MGFLKKSKASVPCATQRPCEKFAFHAACRAPSILVGVILARSPSCRTWSALTAWRLTRIKKSLAFRPGIRWANSSATVVSAAISMWSAKPLPSLLMKRIFIGDLLEKETGMSEALSAWRLRPRREHQLRLPLDGFSEGTDSAAGLRPWHRARAQEMD